MKQPDFSLVQYRAAGDTLRVGLLSAETIFALPAELGERTMMSLIESWQSVEDRLRDLETASLDPVPDAELLAPLTYPNKVLCVGANYYSHAAEMNTKRPDPASEPFFFFKPPTTTIVGQDALVAMPNVKTPNLDWEAELAVVISRSVRNIAAEEAHTVIAGYCVANDLSARGQFARPEAVFPPFAYDWVGHKGQDGFCPLGPGIVPHWKVADPMGVRMTLEVNGEVKQDANTSDMVIDIYHQIAAASRLLTLEPGDVILTGTPAGVGMPRGTFLKAGDVMTVRIDGIGELKTTLTDPINAGDAAPSKAGALR
jgi:2-keto-4-pentenoate hydratase/2-oxohepta-3-ene-1,7-dioic acid hydratase in catechol pathway